MELAYSERLMAEMGRLPNDGLRPAGVGSGHSMRYRMLMAVDILERLLSPAERLEAVIEIAAMGDDGVQILESLFSRQAANDFGSNYRDIGAYGCGLEAAIRLGPSAKPLEPHLREGVAAGWLAAAASLGNLESLEPASIEVLIEATAERTNLDLQCEAAVALIKHGLASHPALSALEHQSEVMARGLQRWRSEFGP